MPKRIFVSFAIEDKFARDNLVHQAKQKRTPFEFTDMSVKSLGIQAGKQIVVPASKDVMGL